MPNCIASLVALHAEEAADLWTIRRTLPDRPHMVLKDLWRWDERIEAQLDGLRLAGPDAGGIIEEALPLDRAGEVFVRAILAMESGDERRLQQIREGCAESSKLAEGWIAASGWLPWEKVRPYMQPLAEAEESRLLRVALAAAAINRQHPGHALERAIVTKDARLRARALQAIGELGLPDWLPAAEKNLAHEDEDCRFAAAWTWSLRSGDRKALPILQQIAQVPGPHQTEAIRLLCRCLDARSARFWRGELSTQTSGLRAAIIGAGAAGDPEAIPWLIDQMAVDSLARIAGEAFTLITGADLDRLYLKGQRPAEFHSGPTDNPEDENVAMDPDDDLPWPDREKILKWWHSTQTRFTPGSRYLMGQPITDENCKEWLKTARLRQRAAAALELARRQPSQPLFNHHAPARQQMRSLGINSFQQ